MTVRIAVLNTRRELVDAREVEEEDLDPADLRCGDLPTNGTFRHDEEAGKFVPLGHGHGKPATPPVPEDYVLFKLVKALEAAGIDAGSEVGAWKRWYEGTMRRRQEELMLASKRRRGV